MKSRSTSHTHVPVLEALLGLVQKSPSLAGVTPLSSFTVYESFPCGERDQDAEETGRCSSHTSNPIGVSQDYVIRGRSQSSSAMARSPLAGLSPVDSGPCSVLLRVDHGIASVDGVADQGKASRLVESVNLAWDSLPSMLT